MGGIDGFLLARLRRRSASIPTAELVDWSYGAVPVPALASPISLALGAHRTVVILSLWQESEPWLSDLEFSLWSDHLRQDSPRAYKDLLERLKDKVQVKYIFDGVELDGNTVAVSFDSHGRVNAKHFRPSYAPRSLYDEIRDWIRSKLSP